MKCICPMGGDRVCPDKCIIAAWHGLPEDQRTKERRRPIVKSLREQNYTQEAIALQLGVSQPTIVRDLETLFIVNNVQERGKDTRGRDRSPGRPKGSKPKAPQRHYRETKIVALADKGLTRAQIAAEAGIGQRQVRHVVEREQIRREAQAEPIIDRAELSLTAQQKLDIAIRQHKRKLSLEYEQRVRDDIEKRIDGMVLPYWKEQIDEAQELYKHRRGAMEKETFNTIRRALHPDSRNSISDKKLAEAFDTFMGLEKFLLNEKDSPTAFKYPDGSELPSSLAEWDKMRRKPMKRANGSNIRPRS